MCQRRMSEYLFCSPQRLFDDESHRTPISTRWNPSAKSPNRPLLALAELRTVKGLADWSRSVLLVTRGNEKKYHRSASAQSPPQPKCPVNTHAPSVTRCSRSRRIGTTARPCRTSSTEAQRATWSSQCPHCGVTYGSDRALRQHRSNCKDRRAAAGLSIDRFGQ